MPEDRNENSLLPEHQIFADEWLLHKKGVVAYQKAYPECTEYMSAAASASRLLKDKHVKAYIDKEIEKILKKYEITRERVLFEEALIAFADIGELKDNEGNFRPLEELPEHLRRAVASVKEYEKTYLKEEGFKTNRDEKTVEYKFWDKGQSLRRLGQVLGLYGDGSTAVNIQINVVGNIQKGIEAGT